MVSIMSMTPVHLVQHGATLVIVGLTISLHVAGMFGLSPIFGWMSDRVGRERVIALGQVLLLAALLTTSFGADYQGAVMVGLVLLGLGWSASTVGASALVAESADPTRRTVHPGSRRPADERRRARPGERSPVRLSRCSGTTDSRWWRSCSS